MDNSQKNWKQNKKLIWAAIIFYVAILAVVGKLYAERYFAGVLAESRFDQIQKGIDDATMDEIVDNLINRMLGDSVVSGIIQYRINGDDVNDVYHALTNYMRYKVYAVEKTSDGRYRVGVIIGNNDNTAVAMKTWEIIKDSYSGNVLKLWDDIHGDISQLISQYFMTAADFLNDSDQDVLITKDFVISVDPTDDDAMPVVENEGGNIGFVLTCAGIPYEVGAHPPISDQRKPYSIAFWSMLVVGVAGIVYLIYVGALGKRKTVQIAEVSAPDQPAYENKTVKTAVLYARTPQHNNVMFAVHDTPVFIGRNPSDCKVVFAEGTAGISGRHCAVSFDASSGDFILTDLNSSYGTFLQNGVRLTANTPYRIRSGEGFFVGDSNNTFMVELR